MNSLFCRHNKFTADCSICSKGTLLDSSAAPSRARASRPSASGSGSGSSAASGRGTEPSRRARVVAGPYVSAGPYENEEGRRYEVRFERVPGGLRLASWSGGAIERAAPVLSAADLPRLVSQARERSIVPERDVEPLERAVAAEPAGDPVEAGASAGRAGDMREELRVEANGDGMLRIARWLYRPNQGWELQEAPVMLPAKRFAEAIRNAARGGVLARPAATDG